ncbi:hypothetical protein [Desulfoluna spongiiphila]|uniref:hypothetical protein n=1 Tax=Desulfoluna spongiiphila TaxID=419481 RepID=UPI00125946F5|nr:hypothetical protein [Desulfoluna spongiiphila]VVS94451.1 prokaryotic membrane lipoprotein lipid attachment site profile [Desulfoluna spongiiphila]
MTKRTGRGHVAAGMVLLLVLTGCAGEAARTYPQWHPCAGESQALPAWMHGVEVLDGYYVGVGQAGPMGGNFFLQKMRARDLALVDLLDQVQVTVESSMELMESQTRKAHGDLSATRRATRRLRVASSLTFTDVTRAGSYMDPSTCTFWVRYTVRRDIADNLVALKQAKALHRMTYDEEGASPAQKLRWITDAQARLNDVDFSVLSKDAGNKNHLTALFIARKAELEQSGIRGTVWMLSAPEALRATLAPRLSSLAETHGAIFVGVSCREAHECVGQAREYAGDRLVWIKAASQKSSGSLGMLKGTLRLGSTRFDVHTGTLLATHTVEGNVFGFHEKEFDWAGLAEQLLDDEEMKKVVE